ncbi:MAG TPA: sigma-70 family RNA polymerase sigma factor [Bryobacteraceae bacterium]|jgi:RNA polymerase sigma-70 factor (ECF subfamily)
MVDARTAAEQLFRNESGRILAALIRISGSFDRAEEALQEAFAIALAAWQEKGVPDNSAAWIMTTAHRRLIDSVRRDNTRRDKQDALQYETELAASLTGAGIDETAMHFPDDRLRLIFTCCHPALNQEAQVALTLRTLGGLSTPEIAKAFLLPEPTLAQRIVRAKRKIQEARIPYEIPPPDRLRERLASVQAVIYLVFNEGYAAMSGDQLVRRDLCAEAIRLGRVLCELMPDQAENLGLLALMLLQDSRRDARVRNGELVTMEEQDRSLWDHAAIAEGLASLDQAIRLRAPGPYQLQAAIAALHAQARTPEETDWTQIAALYGRLLELNPSRVVALNHAVAVAMSAGLESGLKQIDDLKRSGELENYYLFHAARAEILRRLNQRAGAAEAYQRALTLATNRVERDYLERRLRQVADT